MGLQQVEKGKANRKNGHVFLMPRASFPSGWTSRYRADRVEPTLMIFLRRSTISVSDTVYHRVVCFRQQKTVTWRGFWQKSPRRRLGQSSADFQVMWYLVSCVFHHAVRLHMCRNHPWSCDKRLQTCWRRPKKMSFVGGASTTCRTLVRMVGQYSALGIEQLRYWKCLCQCRYRPFVFVFQQKPLWWSWS